MNAHERYTDLVADSIISSKNSAVITLAVIVIGIVLFGIGQHTAAYLIIAGIVVKYFLPFILTITNLPGRLISFPEDNNKHNRARYLTGIVISITIQSYAYLAYVAFLVAWSQRLLPQDNALIVWSISFLAAITPIAFALRVFRKDVTETAQALKDISEKAQKVVGGPEVQIFKMETLVTSITSLIAIAGFFAFVFRPIMIHVLYGWFL